MPLFDKFVLVAFECDCVLVQDDDDDAIGNTYLLHASVAGQRFSASVYAGELPGSACGVNDRGVGFTLNSRTPLSLCTPVPIDPAMPRHVHVNLFATVSRR